MVDRSASLARRARANVAGSPTKNALREIALRRRRICIGARKKRLAGDLQRDCELRVRKLGASHFCPANRPLSILSPTGWAVANPSLCSRNS